MVEMECFFFFDDLVIFWAPRPDMRMGRWSFRSRERKGDVTAVFRQSRLGSDWLDMAVAFRRGANGWLLNMLLECSIMQCILNGGIPDLYING